MVISPRTTSSGPRPAEYPLGLYTAPKGPDQGDEAEIHNPQPYYCYNHIQLKPLTLRTAL